MTKPKIVIIGTGGTIVSVGATASQLTGYDIVGKDVNDIISAVPELANVADITSVPVCNIGSSNINLEIWLDMALLINRMAASDEVDGFVITHGTDTMEETAFFLNLTLKTDKPVVMTGSMRPATALSADGPLNLLNAVRVAASSSAADKGVLVCLNGAIHGARDVTKSNTVAVETFVSPCTGPLGYVIGDDVQFLCASVKPHTLQSEFFVHPAESAADYPKVGVLLSYAGQDKEQIQAALSAGYDGLVLDSFGNSTVSHVMEETLGSCENADMPIVRASRTGSGPVTAGKEVWQQKGFIPAGTLSAVKSRILLQLGLKQYGADRKILQRLFRTY